MKRGGKMDVLNFKTLTQAVEERIRKYMPTIKITRQQAGGGFVDETLPLNVYRNEGEGDIVTGIVHDVSNPACFPFVFVSQEPPMLIRSTAHAEGVMCYDYSIRLDVDLYIDKEPESPARIPRMREELNNAALQLERLLQQLELFRDFSTGEGDVYELMPLTSYQDVTQGMVNISRIIEISEMTIAPEHSKIEAVELEIKG